MERVILTPAQQRKVDEIDLRLAQQRWGWEKERVDGTSGSLRHPDPDAPPMFHLKPGQELLELLKEELAEAQARVDH